MTPIARPVLFGEVLFDRFPDGTTVFGGAPLNVALHLDAFGFAPLLVSAVGDDPLGERLRATMQARGMETTGIAVDPHHPTGCVDVALADGEPTFTIRPDAAWDFVPADHVDATVAGLLYHGSLALRHPASRATFERLKAGPDAPRFLDVNLRSPWWSRDRVRDRVADARWIKLNAAELAALADGGDEAAMARELLDLGTAELLVVTRGAAGACAYPRDGIPHEVRPAARPQTVVDTVGAGDAFAAVLIAGLLGGWELTTTLERAQAFASRIVGCRGAVPDGPTIYRETVANWRNG